MTTIGKTFLIAAGLSTAITLGSQAPAGANCGSDHGQAKETKMSSIETQKKTPDIVDVAAGAETFKTLVAAVKAAGLVETLKGEGPFTVFAPTDEAFAKLPKGTVEDLLKPENKKALQDILTYHVVAGRVMAADVVKLKDAKTVQGAKVSIRVKDDMVMIDNATVVQADLEAGNGVIHVIDSVILPKEPSAGE